MAQSRSGPAA